jgi:hypothetical protein
MGSSMLASTCTMPYVFGTAPQGGRFPPKLLHRGELGSNTRTI